MISKKISSVKFPVLHYTIAGNGNTIVLLHGFPLDGTIWDKITTELSANYTVIVPDIPGSGDSKFKGETLSVEDMATSVKLILDRENINKAVVAGHSMGGYAALAFAELFPDTISGLGMIHSTAATDSDEKKEQRKKSIALFEKGGKDAFIKQMIPVLFAKQNIEQFSKPIEQLTMLALLTEKKSMIAFYNAMINRPNRKGNLKDSKMPVVWVLGENDSVIPPENLTQQTSLSNVNFVHVHKNCGHMGMIEMPEQLIDNLKSFMAYCYSEPDK